MWYFVWQYDFWWKSDITVVGFFFFFNWIIQSIRAKIEFNRAHQWYAFRKRSVCSNRSSNGALIRVGQIINLPSIIWVLWISYWYGVYQGSWDQLQNIFKSQVCTIWVSQFGIFCDFLEKFTQVRSWIIPNYIYLVQLCLKCLILVN